MLAPIVARGACADHFVKQRREVLAHLRAGRGKRFVGFGWGKRFVQMLDEEGEPPAPATPATSARSKRTAEQVSARASSTDTELSSVSVSCTRT